MEAEAVNRRGYYIVGCINGVDVRKSVMTMKNSLQLYVPERQDDADSSDNKGNKKVYNLTDIGDLQSKLMLIGGQQGKENELGQIEKDCFLQVRFTRHTVQ